MNVNSWDDVDNALKRLGEIEIQGAKISGDATLEINVIKEKAKKEAEGLESEKTHLEKLVTIYCESQKAEFAKKRSKEFNFGTVGFRTVKNVSLPRDKTKTAALLKSLKAFGLNDCIAYEEKADKEKINELADETIVKLGLKRTVKDSFRIIPAIEKIGEML
jgi:phage host-nuclease inhibitor protein Gam